MVIVSDGKRRCEFDTKLKYDAFRDIADRLDFLSYDRLAKNYGHEVEASSSVFKL